MTDIKNLILRCGGAHAEHPMKHYRCTKSDLERFAAAIRREALLEAADYVDTFAISNDTPVTAIAWHIRNRAKELE